MIPPETILDRWVKEQSRRHPEFEGYVGKLDVDEVEPSLGFFLRFLQSTMTSALALENTNASGGTKHPPFHFDYLQVKGGIRNAFAFQHEDFSFIVITLPLIELLWSLSTRLANSVAVQALLEIDSGATRLEAFRALLFQFQLTFLVSHEYTHHVHKHCSSGGSPTIWTEFAREDAIGGLYRQAQELDADSYALYLVLANFLRGGGRRNALDQLGQKDVSEAKGDELLLTCLFVALIALFGSLWPEDLKVESIYDMGHPPAPVRIEYSRRCAKMWSAQNDSVPDSWFDTDRLNALFSATMESIRGGTPSTWDTHIEFLESQAGAKYDEVLLEHLELVRKGAESPLTEKA